MLHSPTHGELSFKQVISKIIEYIDDGSYEYKIIIGTDSRPTNNGLVELITALVVQRMGHGGIYFWQRKRLNNVFNLRPRIYQEAMASLDFARRLIESGDIPLLSDDLEIHVDVGTNGETRTMIKEVAGMITGSGFPVKTKPEAYAASKVADRHT